LWVSTFGIGSVWDALDENGEVLAKVVYYFYLIIAPLILINIFIAMTNDVYTTIYSDKVWHGTVRARLIMQYLRGFGIRQEFEHRSQLLTPLPLTGAQLADGACDAAVANGEQHPRVHPQENFRHAPHFSTHQQCERPGSG
jgi:hypothetical protein